MSELFILVLFVVAACVVFIIGGLGVMAYVYITQGKQAAIQFYKKEF